MVAEKRRPRRHSQKKEIFGSTISKSGLTLGRLTTVARLSHSYYTVENMKLNTQGLQLYIAGMLSS